MKFTLEKGRSRLNLEAADHKILDILEGRDFPALSRSRIRGIIETGIRDHAPEDIRDRSVAVIIPDDTRLWARGDLFVPAVIDTLTGLGVDPGRICVIIALGTHRDIPAHGFAALCGEGTGSRVKVINSAGRDPDRLTHIGTTSRGTRLTVTREAWEADHIIIFGGILHHMLAGYGGGRKYILPGIAGESAIMANHALAIDRDGTPHPLVTQAVCRGNPVSEDMQEGADLFLKHKTCTYAAVVANGRGEIFHADAGELRATFEQGCGHLDRACCVDVDQKADFILFSAGGHRTDGQLYQATKALFNAVNVAKEGADLMFVAGCGQGVGNDSFAEALTAFRNRPGALGKKLAGQFHMPAYVALRVIDMLTRFRITLVSDLDEATTRALGFEFTRDPRQLITGLHGKGYIIPFAENILPRKKGE